MLMTEKDPGPQAMSLHHCQPVMTGATDRVKADMYFTITTG